MEKTEQDPYDELFISERQIETLEKDKERVKAIKSIAKQFGYQERKNIFLISRFEMVFNLNNCYHAPLFAPNGYNNKVGIFHEDWAVPIHDLHVLGRKLNRTIRNIEQAEEITNNGNVFYRIAVFRSKALED